MTLLTIGASGGLRVNSSSASAMRSAAGCMSAQWKGALTGSGTARRMPCSGASFTARSIADFVPLITICPWRIIVRDLGDFAFGGGCGETLSRFDLGPEKSEHRALPWRHGLLHGLSAQAQQLRGFGHGERASGSQRRIFAERMARHERRLDCVRSIFLAKRSIGRQRYRHQRGLRVGCQRQRRFRPLPQGARKALAKRLIDLFEHVTRHGEALREALSHANGLAALPWKCECKCHAARVVTRRSE